MRAAPLLAPLLAGLLAACQVAPGTGRQAFNIIPAGQEAQMGAEAHPDVLAQFGGAYDDPALQAYVAGLGQRLARASEVPDAEFRFTVLDSDIVNAMALPGGYVYVTRGLVALAGSEAELAGVLAHEIGHVTARHSSQRVSRQVLGDLVAGVVGAVIGVPGVGELAQLGSGAYLQSYSRDQESEADSIGIRYLGGAGYDPRAMAGFLARLYDQARLEAIIAGRSPDDIDAFNFMASHPRTLERVQAATMAATAGGIVGRDEFLARIDGLTWGRDPAEGVVRDRAFLHPGLGIRFQVPPGFTLANSDDKVTASHPQGAVIQFDTAPGGGDMLAYLGQSWAPRLRLSDPETLIIARMPAATARTRAQTTDGTADLRLVAIDGGAGIIFRFLLATRPGDTGFAVALRDTATSLRRLSPEDETALRPLRLRVVTPQPGDSAEILADRMALPDHRLERFRVLNGLKPGAPLPDKVKLVVDRQSD
jgi:predicted Zn-dependent protease